MLLSHLMTFLQKLTFSKDSFRKTFIVLSQTVWIQIKTNILQVIIWVQTVCKSYQQMTKVAAARKELTLTSLYKGMHDTLSQFIVDDTMQFIMKLKL